MGRNAKPETLKRAKKYLSLYQNSMLNLLSEGPQWPERLNQSTITSMGRWGFITKQVDSAGQEYIVISDKGIKYLDEFNDTKACLRSNPDNPVSKGVNKWLATIHVFQKVQTKRKKAAA